MNYRMYTDADMNKANMTMLEDISMEDGMEMDMHMPNGVHEHEGPIYETMAPQNMAQMYGAKPMEEMMHMSGNKPMKEMMPVYGSMPMGEMDDMDEMMPMNMEGSMCGMMSCCMMNNMGTMPYMVELEEDEEDEKCGDDVHDIVRKIEKHHPEVLTILSAYGMAYPVAIKIIKRIVILALKHK